MAEPSPSVAAMVLDVATGAEVMTLHGLGNYVWCVAFSPDGKYIASDDANGMAKVWDVATGNEVMTFRGHRYNVFSIAFSPDGKRIVSGGEEVKVWEAATGTELMTLRGHGGYVWSVAFSPDGKRIVAGCGNVKVWDADTGTEVMTLRGHKNSAWSLAFSPDGKTLAIASIDNSIKLLESTAPAGGYELRWNAEAARKIVDELYKEHGFYYEVIDKLKADKALAESVREVALQIANARKWENAEKLKKQSSESAGQEEGEAE
jgi:WD40 repeat protein